MQSILMQPILQKAIHQEELRRKKSAEEVIKLIAVANHAVKEEIKCGSNIDQIKADCSTILSSDLKNIKDLNALNNPPRSWIFQFNSNKLALLFSNVEGHPGAIDFINKHLSDNGLEVNIDSESKASHDTDFELRDDATYKFGNSSINYIQIAALTILRATKGDGSTKQIITGEQLAQDGSRIYDVLESPVIQGVKLPQNLISPDSSLNNWFYILSGELLTPNLGYAFGGSRNESRYDDKVFKTYDCSSHLVELLGSKTTFSTLHMHLAHLKGSESTAEYKKILEKYFPEAEAQAEAVKSVESILGILKPIDSLEVGAVFVYRASSGGGHCGIVTEIEEDGNGIRVAETLSYSREIPFIEGLGYNKTEWESGCEVSNIGSQYLVQSASDTKTYSFFKPINEFDSETYADTTVDIITTEL